MPASDLDAIIAKIESNYRKKTKESLSLFRRSSRIMPGGQSHNARFFEPYPFYVSKARGKHIWDVDGNKYTDYWMGHTALIFGHSPAFVTGAIREQAPNGLLYGAPSEYAYELARLVNECVPCAESVRFCTTGAEATMYAVRLARGYTKRKMIVKIAGGWHGYNSALTFGVNTPYDVPESSGLIVDDVRHIKLATFNDVEKTRQVLSTASEDIAGVIVEPVMGAGGVIPAEKSYLEFLRSECSKIGALLIFDEIITGFRLSLGGAQEYYNVTPDIATLGKILGGGLPVSAVAGRGEILDLADTRTHEKKTERVWIGGGTFSEDALCMRAGIATIDRLAERKKEIYGVIGEFGEKLRNSIDSVFYEKGIITKSTGAGSLFATHFMSEGQKNICSPEDVYASDRIKEKQYYFYLIAEAGIYFIPGHVGAVSTVHTSADIVKFVESSSKFASLL